jgi:hypothetical protein
MLAKVCSVAVNGIGAYPVEVEVNAGYGDTVLVIVGLPDAVVKESRDRLDAAAAGAHQRVRLWPVPGALQQAPELIRCQTGIPGHCAHSVRINWVCARDGQSDFAIGHDDVAALADDMEAELLKNAHGILMPDTR